MQYLSGVAQLRVGNGIVGAKFHGVSFNGFGDNVPVSIDEISGSRCGSYHFCLNKTILHKQIDPPRST
jgi:hypothetical protein